LHTFGGGGLWFPFTLPLSQAVPPT
jgi:hypothetical protein